MRNLLLFLLFLCIACTEILSVPDISMEEISIFSPGETEEITIPEIHFSWSSLAAIDTYRLQLFLEAPPSSSILLLDTLVQKNQYSDSLAREGNYRWRVRGVMYQILCYAIKL